MMSLLKPLNFVISKEVFIGKGVSSFVITRSKKAFENGQFHFDPLLLQHKRCFSITLKNSQSNESVSNDGTTTLRTSTNQQNERLNKELEKCDRLGQFNILQYDPTIVGLTTNGFVLDEANTITTHGVIVLQDKLFLWEPKLEQKAFNLFRIVSPRPDILIIGTGKTTKVVPEIRKYLSSLGIQCEMLDTRNALSTFNVLQSEGRRVAAAFFPISHV